MSTDNVLPLPGHAGTAVPLRAGGAQYVIDTIAGLPPVIAEIDRRLADGEAP